MPDTKCCFAGEPGAWSWEEEARYGFDDWLVRVGGSGVHRSGRGGLLSVALAVLSSTVVDMLSRQRLVCLLIGLGAVATHPPHVRTQRLVRACVPARCKQMQLFALRAFAQPGARAGLCRKNRTDRGTET